MTSIFRRGDRRRSYVLKFKKPDGRWQKRCYRTRAAAEEAARLVASGGSTPEQLALRDYAVRWMTRAAPNLRVGTRRQYAWAMDEHVLPALGDLRLEQLDRARVADFLAGKLRDGLARKTVSNIRTTLHACLEEARETDGLIVVNPATAGSRRAKRLAPSKGERAAKVKAFDQVQLAAFLKALSRVAPEHALLLRLMALTGLRLGEALALQWEDVDLEGRKLLVRRGVTEGRVEPTKTSRERAVDLAKGLISSLRTWDARTKASALQRGEPRMPWLFCGRFDGPMGHRQAQDAFKRAARAAKLPPHHTPHSLRHTYASLLLVRGVSPYYVQRQLGHATITMTTDLYGRWLPAGNPAAVDALERDLGTTVGTTGRKRRMAGTRKSL